MLGERLQASLQLALLSEVIIIEVFGCFMSKSNTKAVYNLQVYNIDALDYFAIRASGKNRSTHKPRCSQCE